MEWITLYGIAIGSLSGRIMIYAKKDKEAADLPSIWLTEGRFMLDCGKLTWRRRGEIYKYEVIHWQNQKGTRVSLDSLIRATHPDLKNDAQGRALFPNSFLWRLREERRRSGEAKKRKLHYSPIYWTGMLRSSENATQKRAIFSL